MLKSSLRRKRKPAESSWQTSLLAIAKRCGQQGEILSQLFVPRRFENAVSIFLKLGARRYLVISIAMVAAVIQKDSAGRVADARVAVGSCSAVARRLPELEARADRCADRTGFRVPRHRGPP